MHQSQFSVSSVLATPRHGNSHGDQALKSLDQKLKTIPYRSYAISSTLYQMQFEYGGCTLEFLADNRFVLFSDLNQPPLIEVQLIERTALVGGDFRLVGLTDDNLEIRIDFNRS